MKHENSQWLFFLDISRIISTATTFLTVIISDRRQRVRVLSAEAEKQGPLRSGAAKYEGPLEGGRLTFPWVGREPARLLKSNEMQ